MRLSRLRRRRGGREEEEEEEEGAEGKGSREIKDPPGSGGVDRLGQEKKPLLRQKSDQLRSEICWKGRLDESFSVWTECEGGKEEEEAEEGRKLQDVWKGGGETTAAALQDVIFDSSEKT